MSDPQYQSVVLLLPMQGVDGSTSFLDARMRSTITVGGDVHMTTVQSKVCGWFDGSGDFLNLSSNSLLSGLLNKLTIEAWVYPTAYPSYGAPLFGQGGSGGSTDQYFGLSSIGKIQLYRATSLPGSINLSGASIVPLNTWSNITLSQDGTTYRLFLNGVLDGSASSASGWVNTGRDLNVGWHIVQGYAQYQAYFAGGIAGIRVSDICRYTANFSPPITFDIDQYSHKVGGIAIPKHIPKSVDFSGGPRFKASSPISRLNLDFSGNSSIIDTVKVVDAPVWRRVKLYHTRSGRPVREAWSDPVSGIVTFDHLKENENYNAIAFDHTGVYPPVSMSYQT